MKNLNLVHSIWSTPSMKNHFDSELDNKNFYLNLYSYFLSLLLLKKYGRVSLYCDQFSYEFFSKLPYDEIYILDFDGEIDDKFWIWGKIKTQKEINEPYIHVDGDVFIFKNIFEKYNSHVIVQSIEDQKLMSFSFENTYLKSGNFINNKYPELMIDKYGYNAYNCGIIGFNDINLKKDYISNVENLLIRISKDIDFSEIRKKYDGTFLIAEQSQLYKLINDRNIIPHQVLPYDELIISKNWLNVGNKYGYAHYWGMSKYYPETIQKIRNRIRNDFSSYLDILKYVDKVNDFSNNN